MNLMHSCSVFCLTTERLYPVTLGFSLDDVKLMWLRVLLTDEASYHCNVGLMQACNEIFSGDGNSSLKALHHLSQTLTRVQRRLGSDDALSDSSIALVVSLISQEQIRNQLCAAEIHAKGLEKMIQLRGGLGSLEGNMPLVLSICKADIMLSLQHGKSTMYFRDRMAEVRNLLISKGLRLDYPLTSQPARYNQLYPSLQGIFSDVISFCRLLNAKTHNLVIDFLTFEEVLVSICYRLLNFRSLNESRKYSDVQNIYHVGLIVFMMTTFLQFNRHRIMNHRLLSLCLRDVMDTELHRDEDDLTLWFMIIGGIWISDGAEGGWINQRIQKMAVRRRINTWDEARRSVCMFPWVHALHDQPGCKLWSLVQNSH
ncbi:hypothetical protein BGW36DRAFT_369254 [Talaromyces proteolyticus]|uniref:Uncharacterized protein n=1 Tax=Talaromyces proteolyticus TaxID=1131652 RepID=A0AAD4KXI6_9EURO|nr:uncharacterized protein BGW36DRAFT_369254 [Talaromyces proteolyticus]KAH8703375.1 hypothetical protein BGW36DRAFT_369254 [Talaromyces proteolyticus]